MQILQKSIAPALIAVVPFCLSSTQAVGPHTASISIAAQPGAVADAPEAGSRRLNARELLGSFYERSTVRIGEDVDDISAFVHQAVSRRMKSEPEESVKNVSATILEESARHALDPLLIVAVIERESSFRAKVRGGVGEVGLMQLRPSTAKWVAETYGIPWKGTAMLLDPVINIRLGVQYLAALRGELPPDGRLYLAAYNMGMGRVLNCLRRKITPKTYPSRIMQSYVRLYDELKRDLDAMSGPALASDTSPVIQ